MFLSICINCLEPPDLLPLTFGRDVMNEGSFAQLSCIAAVGDEPMQLSWTFHGSKISSDLGIMTAPIGSRGTMLVISSVGHKHNGTYTCTAKNHAGHASMSTVLRVNGNCNWKAPHNHIYFLSFRSSFPSSNVLWCRCYG